MDRKRKREFWKNKKYEKWYKLNNDFEQKANDEKSNYYTKNIVSDT